MVHQLASWNSRGALSGHSKPSCVAACRAPASGAPRALLLPRPLLQRRSWRAASTAEEGDTEPSISITFITDKDGTNTEVTSPSGEQLRAIMLENKVRAWVERHQQQPIFGTGRRGLGRPCLHTRFS
jgi:hypothetical protein